MTGRTWHRFVDTRPDDLPRPDLNPYLRLHREWGPPVLTASDAAANRGRWDAAFEAPGPLHVEVGPGNGFHLAGMAARHPDVNWLGLEIRYKRVVLCAKKIESAGVARNARIARYDAWWLDDVFAPGGALRGTPAGAYKLPGGPRFAIGWVVIRGGAPVFVFRSRRRTGRIDLGSLQARSIAEADLFRRVDLAGESGRPFLLFGLGGPGAESLRAEFDEVNGRLTLVEERIQGGPRGNIFTLLESLATRASVKVESMEPQTALSSDRYRETKVEVVLKNVLLELVEQD